MRLVRSNSELKPQLGGVKEERVTSLLSELRRAVLEIIDIDDYVDVSSSIAKLTRALGEELNTSYFIPFARRIDPGDKGSCSDFREVARVLLIDILSMIG